ncbi:MAG: type II secretion system protein J [Planctomycetaceae bacterium]
MKRHTDRTVLHRKSVRLRGGYTLLELLVASVLIATLMAAAWNLMTMYSNFLIAGRAQAAEQQLARSLMDLLATDLRSVAPKGGAAQRQASERVNPDAATNGRLSIEPMVVRPFEAGRDTEMMDRSSRTEVTGLIEGAARLPETSFTGDGVSLTLVVARWEPDFRSRPADDDGDMPFASGQDASALGEFGAGSTGDVLPETPVAKEWTQVLYRFVPPRPVRPDEGGLMSGLHRFEIPVEYLGLLTQGTSVFSGDVDASELSSDDDVESDLGNALDILREQGVTGISHEHIPEVAACRFEFLSDTGWRSTWLEAADGERPLAVRVRFKLLSSREHAELSALLGSDVADDPTAGDVEFPEPPPSAEGETNPFAAIHPRPYERMILLGAGRDIRSRSESGSPGEERPFGSSGLFAGGKP